MAFEAVRALRVAHEVSFVQLIAVGARVVEERGTATVSRLKAHAVAILLVSAKELQLADGQAQNQRTCEKGPHLFQKFY